MPYFGEQVSLGYVRITIDTVQSIGTIPANTEYFLVIPEGQNARWRDDGTNPTASVGQPLAIGAELKYDSKSAPSLRFIGQAAGSILNITFYGRG